MFTKFYLSDSDFERLSQVLLGTGKNLSGVLPELALSHLSILSVEKDLDARNFAICARCGTWSYIEDEFCETCQAEDAE